MIDDIFKKLSDKQIHLINNILMISFLFVILYALLSLTLLYRMDVFRFLKSKVFINSIVGVILLYVSMDIFTKKTGTKGKKKKIKVKVNTSRKKKPTPRGSWSCPQCNTYVVGDRCPHCGWRYE